MSLSDTIESLPSHFRFLNDLRPFAPNEQEYKKLSFLLTLKRLQDHTDYANWNPSGGRMQCFEEVFPLVHRFLQVRLPHTYITNPYRSLFTGRQADNSNSPR